jgi:hypothetical protein
MELKVYLIMNVFYLLTPSFSLEKLISRRTIIKEVLTVFNRKHFVRVSQTNVVVETDNNCEKKTNLLFGKSRAAQ